MLRRRQLRALLQPGLRRQLCLPPQRYAAPLAALAQHMGLTLLQIEPATRLRPGCGIQPHQFGHAQAAAIQQLRDQGIPQLLPVGLLPVC